MRPPAMTGPNHSRDARLGEPSLRRFAAELLRRSPRGGAWLGAATLGAALLLHAPPAKAGAQEALAEVLFQDAKRLMADGDYAAACPKLSQSFDADPAGGTSLLLAICYDRLGKTASAWVEYNRALAMARRDQRPDRQSRAEQAIKAIEPRLTWLKLTVTSPVEGQTIKIDGLAFPVNASAPMPIDPGPHHVQATAKGHEGYSQDFEAKGPAETLELAIPELAPLPQDEAPAPPPPEPKGAAPAPTPAEPASEPIRWRPIVGWSLAGVGVASAGVGSWFGLKALSKDKDADRVCSSNPCTDQGGVNASHSAADSALLSDVFFGAAAVTAGLGLYLVITDPGPSHAAATVGLAPLPGGAGALATGSF